MSRPTEIPFKRDRNSHANVASVELFFDLIYAFAATQLSHYFLDNLSARGALQTLVLWFAVWLGWQYTCWVTNWFNPENRQLRITLFALMFLGLLMGTSIPSAFSDGGLMFAVCFAVFQIGRSAFVLYRLRDDDALRPNFIRIFGWLCISGALWITGGLADDTTRLTLWIAAVMCEYFSPMIGFWLPGLGRSATSDWTIDGRHMAERCQLFVIVALGESILATGAGFLGAAHPGAPTYSALLVAFMGSLAMWWIYFDTSSEDGTHAITHSPDPGRIGAYFHYIHVTLIGGIIVAAVADELVLHHPDQRMDLASTLVVVGGPVLYLLGNAAYKKVVYGLVPLSHIVGVLMLAALFPVAFATDRLVAGVLATLVLVCVAAWHSRKPTPLPQPVAHRSH